MAGRDHWSRAVRPDRIDDIRVESGPQTFACIQAKHLVNPSRPRADSSVAAIGQFVARSPATRPGDRLAFVAASGGGRHKDLEFERAVGEVGSRTPTPG